MSCSCTFILQLRICFDVVMAHSGCIPGGFDARNYVVISFSIVWIIVALLTFLALAEVSIVALLTFLAL